MSFLSQLRQSQGAIRSEIKLCYGLTIDDDQRLRLVLYTEQQGGRQAYRVQRQHLSIPPSFFHPGDAGILRALTECSGKWYQHSEGVQLPDNMPAFLAQLAQTRRAYVQSNTGQRHLLDANLSPPEFSWRVGPDGYQTLRCHASANTALVTSGEHGLVVDVTSGRVGYLATAAKLKIQNIRQLLYGFPPSVSTSERQAVEDLCRQMGLPLPRHLPEKTLTARPVPLLSCRSPREGADARLALEFGYEHEAYCFCPGDLQSMALWDGERLVSTQRNHLQEREAFASLRRNLAGALPDTEGPWPVAEPSWWQRLLIEHRPALEEHGFHFCIENGFPFHFVEAGQWHVKARQQTDTHWALTLETTAGGQTIDVVKALQRYFSDTANTSGVLPLEDGRQLVVKKSILDGLFDKLGDWFFMHAPGRLPLSQAYRLQHLQMSLPEQTRWQAEGAIFDKALNINRLPKPRELGNTGIQGRLRPYQWIGVCWMQHLRNGGYNGLLADDMGLGKTLQTLTHLSLEHKKQRLDAPVLIVVPTSLLHNWAKEVEKFCPHLKTLVLHGPQRREFQPAVANHQLVITSYQLIVKDLDFWQSRPLSWVILDEAQAIKNPDTKISRAVRKLQCKHRLCLSGTPMENHLGELWSIMDFLMPGVLGSQKSFKRYYQNSVEREGNERRLQQLLERVAPLLLRRTKSEVAKELPDKTIVQQTLPLTTEQSALYEQTRQTLQQSLEQELAETENEGEKHLMVLAALMKLRQICCDPALLGRDDIPSSKRDHCLDMITELVDEGRSVLLFSQFTRMLNILSRELERMDIAHLSLTGQSKNRSVLVDKFQNGDARVFLISLKAGGAGLNLTRADSVIIYDPWWNQAAEQQASDRAHRIGQKNPVFVYKLISENSIEEKIAQMQTSKAFLSGKINEQAQYSAENFSSNFESLLNLWKEAT